MGESRPSHAEPRISLSVKLKQKKKIKAHEMASAQREKKGTYNPDGNVPSCEASIAQVQPRKRKRLWVFPRID